MWVLNGLMGAQLIDRGGRVVSCLATMRWYWGCGRNVVCFRFWPLSTLMGRAPREGKRGWLGEEVWWHSQPPAPAPRQLQQLQQRYSSDHHDDHQQQQSHQEQSTLLWQ